MIIEEFIDKRFPANKDSPCTICTLRDTLVAWMLCSAIVGDLLCQDFLEFIRKSCRRMAVSCYKMLKDIDLNGGALDCQALEVTLLSETNGFKCSRSIVPSKGQIQKRVDKVKRAGNELCPNQAASNASVDESFRFCFKPSVKLLFKAHGVLDAAAERLVEMPSSAGSFTLIRSLGIVSAVLKLIDVACVDPVIGDHVSMLFSSTCLSQSRERCFPL